MPELTLAEELLMMMSIFCVSHRLMQHLLNLLNKHKVPDIHKTVYQLQKSCRLANPEIMELKHGHFSYFSINFIELIEKGLFYGKESLESCF